MSSAALNSKDYLRVSWLACEDISADLVCTTEVLRQV